ncbi:hypothetical protein RyT2_24260 [Pseudolactococcus yaeyamensis]
MKGSKMDTIKVEKKSQKRLSMSECVKKEFLKAVPIRKCIVIDLNLESKKYLDKTKNNL